MEREVRFRQEAADPLCCVDDFFAKVYFECGVFRARQYQCHKDGTVADVKGQVVNEKCKMGRYFEKVLDIAYTGKQYSFSAKLVIRMQIMIISIALELVVTTNHQ